MKILKIILLVLILIISLVFAFSKYLLYDDQKTIKELGVMVLYLEEYHLSHNQYPTKAEFYKKFQYLGSKLDSEYYYWNGQEVKMGPDYFILQYPMHAKRDFAVGMQHLSEFTGTTYAYSISSCNLGGKCRDYDSTEIISDNFYEK